MFAKRPQAFEKRSQSVRKLSQSSASVRNRSQRVAHAGEAKIVAKRRTVVTFYVLHYKSVNRHRDRGGAWSRNPELSSLLDSSRLFASQLCQQSQGSGGSWSRNPELSSLLDSSRLFASQLCQQSQGSGGSWSRNPELSSLLDSPLEREKERGERRKER